MSKIKLIINLLLLSVIILSCTTSDKAFTGKILQKRKYNKGYHVHNAQKHNSPAYLANNSSSINREESKISDSEMLIFVDDIDIQRVSNDNLLISPPDSIDEANCDLIVFENGEEIRAKVKEVTDTSIKYLRCDNLDGPLYTINKSEVFIIKYSNGTRELIRKDNRILEEKTSLDGMPDTTEPIQPYSSNDNPLEEPPKQIRQGGGFGVIAFIISIISIFFASLLLAPGAIIFGIIGASKNRKSKGLAIAAIIIGALTFVLALAMLAG